MKRLLAASTLFLSLHALALPPKVEADRLMLQAKNALDKKDYAKAVDAFDRADKLGIALPESYYLQYGSALAAQKKWSAAHDVLEGYLNKFGDTGKFYKEALAQYVLAEEKAKEQPKAEHLVLKSLAVADVPTAAPVATPAAAAPAAPPAPARRTRAQLPFTLSEDVWQALEKSEAYQNAPEFKPIRISSAKHRTIDGEYLHTRSTESESSRIEPVAPGVAAKRTAQTIRATYQEKTTETRIESANYMAAGGYLTLGSVTDGKTGVYLKRIDELQGSLFPMRTGAALRLHVIYGFEGNAEFDNDFSLDCNVAEKVPAANVDARLHGDAWKIHCNTRSRIRGNDIQASSDDYFIEEFATMLAVVGEIDLGSKKMVLPTPGYSYVLETTGKYGSKNRVVFDSFDWNVDTAAAEMRPGGAVAVGEKDWGISATDLSIMLGNDILKKARFAERRPAILAAAQGGDAVSQYLIGAGYLYGIGAGVNPQEKVTWLTKAAGQGLLRAMAALADARIRGDGTERDDISGWSLLLQAANEGNAVAQYNAAMFTLSGIDAGGGMARQYNYLSRPAALAMLERSAEAGMSASQYALGHSYLVGSEEHDKDPVKARYWLQKAAAQQFAPAIKDLNGMSD
ncbi:MAG: hypothetical protein ACXU8N_06780 [Telluria sp.]